MARPLRSDPTDAIHHITQHANRHGDCFLDDRDRRFFLTLVSEACEEYDARIIALCLMGNHFHLLVHLRDGGVSAFMHRVTASYARWFNEWHGYRGHLFDDRFHSELVESDEYLLTAVRYISRNPLEMTYRLESYKWSTHLIYLGRQRCPSWIEVSKVLQLIGGHSGYRRFVEANTESDKVSWSAGVRDMPEVPAVERPTLDVGEVDRCVSEVAGCDAALIRAARKGRSNRTRLVALLLAADSQRYPPDEIARHYGFGSKASMRTAVSRARQLVADTPAMAEVLYAARARMNIAS